MERISGRLQTSVPLHSQLRSYDRQTDTNGSPERVSQFYTDNLNELDVLRRASIVNSIYGGRKLVVESSQGATRMRGDT
jgi:LYR motif-containing protein 4